MVELNIETNDSQFEFYEEFKLILNNLKNYFKLNQIVSVDVTIVDNHEIQKLNKKYRGKDYPTDILSFSFSENQIYKNLPVLPLGELIISDEKVKEQAVNFNHSIKREYCYLFTHGLVHLMGYDHEEENERIIMNKIVEDIFSPLGITREHE
ncbi:rRNA maturation RNase YbeY [Mycoplasma sp. 744]|uniref:rRNA maturation RNase YbeY n=1 Tax=unclassified Mycoplasma TaxID=2683645 RepID=UPI00211BC80F|nr:MULTISPECIES: rRNA maturation RNase YbeY [unclassified Mycoplasma]MEA4115221.1 rRNA maturation RNase YbeY [Mycoplasma sp. 744]UUM19227.1 rRNA maturation RNase YbeY [Mycoplasma sp. 1018B]